MKLGAQGQVIKENICPYFKIYAQYKKRSSPVTATLSLVKLYAACARLGNANALPNLEQILAIILAIIDVFGIHIVHKEAFFGHCLPFRTHLAMVGIGVDGEPATR